MLTSSFSRLLTMVITPSKQTTGWASMNRCVPPCIWWGVRCLGLLLFRSRRLDCSTCRLCLSSLSLPERRLVWLTLMVPCSGAGACPGSERRSASSVVSIGMVVVLASAICKIATRQQPLNLLSKRVFYLHTTNGLLLDLVQHIYKIRWYSVCHFSLRNRWSYYIFTLNSRCLF